MTELNAFVKSFRSITTQTEPADTKICAFVNVSIDYMIFHIKCCYCDEMFSIWNCSSFVQHIQEKHCYSVKEFVNDHFVEATANNSQNDTKRFIAIDLNKVKTEQANLVEKQGIKMEANVDESCIEGFQICTEEVDLKPEIFSADEAANFEKIPTNEMFSTQLKRTISDSTFSITPSSSDVKMSKRRHAMMRVCYIEKNNQQIGSKIPGLGPEESHKQVRSSRLQKHKKYIDKLKQDNKFEDFKKKRAAAMREYRARKKAEENKLPLTKLQSIIESRRQAARDRLKRYREARKNRARCKTAFNVEV